MSTAFLGSGHRISISPVVSVLVSVATVRDRLPAFAQPARRRRWAPANGPQRDCAELESGLGASPHEFESRILRRCDQGKRFVPLLDPRMGPEVVVSVAPGPVRTCGRQRTSTNRGERSKGRNRHGALCESELISVRHSSRAFAASAACCARPRVAASDQHGNLGTTSVSAERVKVPACRCPRPSLIPDDDPRSWTPQQVCDRVHLVVSTIVDIMECRGSWTGSALGGGGAR